MLAVWATAIAAVMCVGACGGTSKAKDGEACERDLKSLETAEEAFFASHSAAPTYGTYADLIATQFASDDNGLHTVSVSPDGTRYTLTGTGKNNCHLDYVSS
jgi:hypothetical protein